MSSNEKRGGALSNKDLANVFRRAIHLNGMNDYPGQMHSGYTNAMIPALKKIYKDDDKKLVDAYERHMNEYCNVTPYVSGLPMGVTLALEERNAQSEDFDTSTITGVKTALMGPLSAVGDTIFHSTLRVVAVSVAIDLCMQGSFAGPVLFFLIFLRSSLAGGRSRWATPWARGSWTRQRPRASWRRSPMPQALSVWLPSAP